MNCEIFQNEFKNTTRYASQTPNNIAELIFIQINPFQQIVSSEFEFKKNQNKETEQ